nr:MAG TPA: hypothetical protein [Caudoviricetes sp.]
MPWSVAYTLIPQIIIYFPTHLSFKKTKNMKRWGDGGTLRAPKKAQVRACAINNIYKENIS